MGKNRDYNEDEPETATEGQPKRDSGGVADDDQNEYYHWSLHKGLYRPVGKTQDTVPAGIYEIDNDNAGWYLSKVKFPSDTLLRLPGMPIDYILDQIKVFWERESLFQQTGLLHKRGILMYGPAGSGKTSIIRLLCDDVVKRDGIVVMVTNCRLAENALGGIRQIEARRPILTIIEDIETFMGSSDESSSARALLALLDGETQVEHIVHLACPAPETRILKADLSWVRADELVPGDRIAAFDETRKFGKGLGRKLRVATVEACPLVTKKRFRVKMESGTEIVVSEHHPFLVKLGSCSPEWRFVEDLKAANRVVSIGKPWETDASEAGAYLSAQYDAEGSLNIGDNNTGGRTFRVKWAQAKGIVVDKTKKFLNETGFNFTAYDRKPQTTSGGRGVCQDGKTPLRPQIGIDLKGGKWKQLKFLGSIRPIRLLANQLLLKILDGTKICPEYDKVVSVEEIGPGPVVALGTSTKTFIGEGLLQHNTTNKPDQLEDRIVKRPGRFDLVVGLNHPVAEARRAYLRNLLKDHMPEKELDELVDATEGLGLAHLRELVVASYCLGLDRKETLARLKTNFKKGSLKIKSGKETMGFTVNFPQAEDEKPRLSRVAGEEDD
jgi:hypothetical protein